MKRTKQFLYLNAVLAHLHHYPNSQYADDYRELKDELTTANEVQRRSRKAAEQRKKETTSTQTSKKASQTAKT